MFVQRSTITVLFLSSALFAGCSNQGETTFVENADTSGAETHADTEDHGTECSGHQVHFETGSAELSDANRTTLDRLARCVEGNELDELVITGHTDPEGTEESNHELGMRRGATVAGYLRSAGLQEPDIEVRSAGETNASEVSLRWPQDRRADITAVE